MFRVALPVLLALGGCAGMSGNSSHQLIKSFTPGFTIDCIAGCSLSFGNADDSPIPGERAVPDHQPVFP